MLHRHNSTRLTAPHTRLEQHQRAAGETCDQQETVRECVTLICVGPSLGLVVAIPSCPSSFSPHCNTRPLETTYHKSCLITVKQSPSCVMSAACDRPQLTCTQRPRSPAEDCSALRLRLALSSISTEPRQR